MWAVFDSLAQPERVSSTRRNVMLINFVVIGEIKAVGLLFVVSVFIDLIDDGFRFRYYED